MKDYMDIVWGIEPRHILHYYDKRRIAIDCYAMDDLSEYAGTLKQFQQEYDKKHLDEKSKERIANATLLYNFCHSIKKGEYIVYRSMDDNLIHIGQVSGGYEYFEKEGEYAHTYPINWIRHIPVKYFSKKALQELDGGKNLFSISDNTNEFLSYLKVTKQLVKENYSDWESARISQLLSYLGDCQQGVRDLNSQILTVLTVVSTLLSLLFGISVFRLNDMEVADQIVFFPKKSAYFFLNTLITRRRLYFWFTIIIFAATVSYIIFLAIEEILRYHYAQHIADRLHTLIPGTADDIDRNALLIFEQFKDPIRTLNYQNLCTSHSMFNFFVAYLAGALATIFCLGLTITQYILLPSRRWYDHTLLVVVILVLSVSIAMFIRFYAGADIISEIAFEIGNDNLEVRKGIAGKHAKLYRNAEEFREFFHYLILPRIGSLLKVFLIVAGFCVASVYHHTVYQEYPNFIQLVYIVLVLEFLLYQAGYQFNDIRGIKDGKTEHGRRKRLVDYIAGDKPFRIQVSIIMVVLRLITAIILIAFLGGSVKEELIFGFIFFIGLVAAFEYSREKKRPRLTILLIGTGFPLRFFAGVLAASEETLFSWTWYDIILMILILWVWGKVVSLLSWVRDVDYLLDKKRIEENKLHVKAHYNKVYSVIKDRHREKEKGRSILSYKGEASDLWSRFYLLLLVLMAIIRFTHMNQKILIIDAIICLFFSGKAFFDESEKRFIDWFVFTGTLLFDIFGTWVLGDRLLDSIVYNILLFVITVSVLILKRKSMEKLKLPKVQSRIFESIIGKEAYEGLKLKRN